MRVTVPFVVLCGDEMVRVEISGDVVGDAPAFRVLNLFSPVALTDLEAKKARYVLIDAHLRLRHGAPECYVPRGDFDAKAVES